MLGARPGLVAGLLVKMETGDRFSRPEKRILGHCLSRVRATFNNATHHTECAREIHHSSKSY